VDSRLKAAPSVKLIVAIMSGADADQSSVEEEMIRLLGPIQRRSERYDFSAFSNYYDDELGGRVAKYFVSFQRVIEADKLVSVKLITEGLEEKYRVQFNEEFRRTVNLDPGYVTGWNVVLSTVKNHSHRLYFGEGVFGELTLRYQNRAFRPLPWTYPDYRSSVVQKFLRMVRSDWFAECSN